MIVRNENRSPLVLVVEDDDLLRFASSYELAESGFKTLVARTADEAVAILNEFEAIDALFTDISMPGNMNGVDLAHHVREKQPQAYVLITSGDDPPADPGLPENSHFIPKPYTLPDVAAMIREHVEEEEEEEEEEVDA
jgi:DNA-binding NtrC family response regulator